MTETVHSLVPVRTASDILPRYRGTPVERLLRYHNLEEDAVRHFTKHAANYEIGDPVQFVVTEVARFQGFYPKLLIAPLLYAVEDDRLTQIT
jgi:hypothetical protein